MRDGLYQVTRGPVCAGFVVEAGKVTMQAPILRARGRAGEVRRVDASRYLILFTGSRLYRDKAQVRRDLLAVQARFACHPDQLVIIHGDAEGLDSIARDEATALGMVVRGYPADWATCAPDCQPGHRKHRRDGTEYCPTAGHRRNAVMVDLVAHGEAAGRGVVAYPVGVSRGTRGAMAMAEAAGLKVWNRTNAPARLP